MRPRSQRQYRGMGNRHNRFKRDTKRLALYEKNKPAGFIGFKWQK